jgi:adenosylhomocysteine nucleosidase
MIACLVIISADIEWQAFKRIFGEWRTYERSPFGEFFVDVDALPDDAWQIIYFHGGWGKIAAAASLQYAIDQWRPDYIVNLGTCGGLAGEIERGEILLADKTIVYDIVEQMGDPETHIAHYSTTINLSWLREPYPQIVRRGLLVSGDRDLLVDDLTMLRSRYGAIAGDWESGAIAWVAARNKVKLLILRGVSDLVGAEGGEAYGNIELYRVAAGMIMENLLGNWRGWIPNN